MSLDTKYKWFIFTREFKVSPSITIPVGEVWNAEMSSSSNGIAFSWTLTKDPSTVGSSFGGADSVSKISGVGNAPFEETNEPQISEPKTMSPRTGTKAQAEADSDKSFFAKHGKHIGLGIGFIIGVGMAWVLVNIIRHEV